MPGRGQIVFHTGALFVKNTAANATPIRVATLQEVGFDFKASNKELFGENQFAEAIGRGNTKISGKAKTGRFNGALMNEVFFKQPASSLLSQAKLLALDEAATVASASVTAANGANFLEDLGVQNAATGAAYTRVAAAPAAGQYVVNEATGVYTLNASENGNALSLCYLYKTTVAGAKTLNIDNQLAGEAPTFKAIFSQRFQGQTITLTLNALVAEGLGFNFKSEDFAMPDVSFAAQADAFGRVGDLSMTAFQ
jgi:hypothetical protein